LRPFGQASAQSGWCGSGRAGTGVLKIVEPLAACLVAAVHDPAVRLQQDGRPEEALAGPPIAGTAGAAAGAENAFVESVDLGAVRGRLLPSLFRRRRDGLKPRLDRDVLGVEVESR
jgi:hypothetical protein